MSDGLVSVIIPVYNRENTIKRAVDSVLCQTYPYLEVIVVDDDSTDNTVQILREYTDPRVRLICLKENGGANKARNVGIENSKGEYIAFQDSDDEWLPDKLEQQVRRMRDGGYLACYSAFNFCEGHDIYTIPSDFEDQKKYEDGLGKILAGYNVVDTPTLVIKRRVLLLLENEYFDEHLPRLQDYDFAIRISKVCRMAYINRPLVNAFSTEGSISKNSSNLYRAFGRIIRKHGSFLDIGQVMDILARAEAGIDRPHQMLEDLQALQKSAGLKDIECKDKIFAHISKKLHVQNELLYKQYQLAVDNLQDRKFAIYGAGTVGHEAYHALQKKGLHPASFLVTKCGKEKFIDDVPVLSVDEYSNKDDMVIISIDFEHQIELMNNLTSRSYKQFCIYCKKP